MEQIHSGGSVLPPADFKYARVMEKGRPVHEDDFFSFRHPRMSAGRRAKIFAPFAALSGFEEEIGAKKVLYEKKRIPDTDEIYRLNDRLNRLRELTAGKKKRPVRASVEYYVPCQDPHNKAYMIQGVYQTAEGIVSRADPVLQQLTVGGLTIAFDDIFSISIADPDETENAFPESPDA